MMKLDDSAVLDVKPIDVDIGVVVIGPKEVQ